MPIRLFTEKATSNEDVINDDGPLTELEKGLENLAERYKMAKSFLNNHSAENASEQIPTTISACEATLNAIDELYKSHILHHQWQPMQMILAQAKKECLQYKTSSEPLLDYVPRYKVYKSLARKIDTLYLSSQIVFTEIKNKYLTELSANKFTITCSIL